MENKQINILDYFYLLYRGRKFVFWNFFIVCVLAAGASLIMPKYYRSTAILLPPSETQDAFGFSEALSALPVNISLGSQGSPSDIYMGIMKSQTMAISIIERFGLIDVYESVDRDRAMETLKGLTKIKLTKEGLIEVSVEDQDPVRAAEIANMYWAKLDSLNQQFSRMAARERGDFLVQQIRESGIALNEAESELKEFQLKTKALSPYQQQQIAISVSAELEMDILKSEALLKEYRGKSFSNAHPLVKELLDTIEIREEQLHAMRFGSPKGSRESLFVPLQDVPELTLQYARLMRRVEILSQFEQLLSQQYEEAKIGQVNPTSTVNILDRAEPPMKKSRPKRSLIVIVAGAATLFFSIVAIVIIEFFNRLTEISQENRDKIKRIARLLRIDAS